MLNIKHEDRKNKTKIYKRMILKKRKKKPVFLNVGLKMQAKTKRQL